MNTITNTTIQPLRVKTFDEELYNAWTPHRTLASGMLFCWVLMLILIFYHVEFQMNAREKNTKQ
jgi:hypothetical protein